MEVDLVRMHLLGILGHVGLTTMIKQRHPSVAERILVALHNAEGPESTRSTTIFARGRFCSADVGSLV